jgi:hypothetical protein
MSVNDLFVAPMAFFMRATGYICAFIAISICVAPGLAASKLSETDRKEIVLVLFERAFPRTDSSKRQTVLLDPNTDLNFMPDIPGLDFRKLG